MVEILRAILAPDYAISTTISPSYLSWKYGEGYSFYFYWKNPLYFYHIPMGKRLKIIMNNYCTVSMRKYGRTIVKLLLSQHAVQVLNISNMFYL
jgi:hypothetical protein